MPYKITSQKHGNHSGLSSLEAARMVFGSQIIQVRLSWSATFDQMAAGETKSLRDGYGNLTLVTRTED